MGWGRTTSSWSTDCLPLPSVICWWWVGNRRWGSVWRAVFWQKYFNFWMQLQPLDFLVSHFLWISAAVHCLPGDSSDSHLLSQGCLTLPLAQSHPEAFPCLSLCCSLQDSRQEGPGNPHPWLTDHLWIKPFSVQPAGDFKPPIANSRCPLILWANRQSGTKHSNVSTCIPGEFRPRGPCVT